MKEINNLAISELNSSYKNAKKYFILNAKNNPSFITYNNLAWYYFKCEELNPFWYELSTFKKSIKYCLEALRLKTNVSSLRLLRNIHYAKKEYAEAAKIQELIFENFRCEQDIENYMDDYYVMGCINIGLKDYKTAKEYLEKAYNHYYLKQNISDDYAFFTYALCLIKLGQYDEANKIGEYILDTLGEDSILLNEVLRIYYCTDNFEKLNKYIEQFQRSWAIQKDELAIILYTYKKYYSNDEVEKRYVNIIDRVKKGYRPKGARRRELIKLKKVYEQIEKGIKPVIQYEPLVYFTRNYIKC